MSMPPQSVAERLAEAERAYHSLVTGTMPRVVVDISGERVEFTPARRDDLYRYIQELRGLLPGLPTVCNGPAGFLF